MVYLEISEFIARHWVLLMARSSLGRLVYVSLHLLRSRHGNEIGCEIDYLRGVLVRYNMVGAREALESSDHSAIMTAVEKKVRKKGHNIW